MQAELYTIEALKTGRLSIMAHPRGNDWLEDEIKALRVAKVDILVSLLTKLEINELKLIDEPVLCQTTAIEYLALPITDRQVPPFQTTTFDFLTRLNQSLKSGKHIAVHCRMGIGRSALVAASLLVMNNMPANQAFDAIAISRGLAVPDTEEQREWVLKFEKYYERK